MSEINQYVFDWAKLESLGDDHSIFPIYARVMRQRRKLTRAEMAGQTQINVATLLAIENGLIPYEDMPKVDVQNLENCFGLTYRYFRERYNAVLGKGSAEDKNEGVG